MLKKIKTIKIDVKNYDSKEERKKTIDYINKLEKLFEIYDSNLKILIRNYIAVYVKNIVNHLKRTNPKKFKEEANKSKKLMQKIAQDGGFAGCLFVLFNYYKITFEDFLYLFLKILNFVTGLKIKLELQENKDIFLRIFFEENKFDEPAEFLNYQMQLKPYSKVYEMFFQNITNNHNEKDHHQKKKAEEAKNNEANDKLAAAAATEGEKEKLIDFEKNKSNKKKDANPAQDQKQKSESSPPNLFIRKENNNEKEILINNNKNNNPNNPLVAANINEVKLAKDARINNNPDEQAAKVKLLELEKSKEIMRDFLKRKFEVDLVDINDHHYFPPHFIFVCGEYDKFRKYLQNDDIHECPKEEQYKLWVTLDDYQGESSNEESDEENENENENEKTEEKEDEVFDVEKDFPCEDCFYYRNIDRLRIISASIDKVVNLKELESCDDFYKNSFCINNYKAYEERTTAKYLIFNRLNVYSDKSQGELIRLFRNFFGEKIAFYFLWYCFLIKYIVILMIMSSCIFVLVNFSSFFVTKELIKNSGISALDAIYIIYSFIVGVWSTMLMKAWKSKESLYSYIWGCDDNKSDEPFRDEFEFDKMTTFVFTKRVPVQKAWKKTLRKLFTALVILGLCVASAWIMLGILKLKDRDLLAAGANNSSLNSTVSNRSDKPNSFNLFKNEVFDDKAQRDIQLNEIGNSFFQTTTNITDNSTSTTTSSINNKKILIFN